MASFLPRGESYVAAAEAVARLVVDQFEERAGDREPLTYWQKVVLVKDAMDAFHAVAARLDREQITVIPAPRREIPAVAREAVYERDGYRCLACGSVDRLSIDHVVPLDLGGAHAMENFQTLCVSCNSAKGVQSIDYRLACG